MTLKAMSMAPRRFPIGAEHAPATRERGSAVAFRVWAPTHERVSLVLEPASASPRELALVRDGEYHAAVVLELAVGTRYQFRLGDEPELVADPASRSQPAGPFGPSEVIDPLTFPWTDAAWGGLPPQAHVLYELHVGTFTPAGTYAAAADELPFLAELGITTIELMPLAESAGRYSWGYDGVNLFAPSHNHGTPDDLRRFIDRAHGLGLAVILDVVYNHFGPDGNSMFRWSPYYKNEQGGDWGDALAFDTPTSGGVRELYIANARYWIEEFHFDGLRIDATQAIIDTSETHILTEIIRAARAAAGDRVIFIVGENEPQDAALLAPAYGFDALWNDDFHHTARVALTGVVDGYLHDYHGTPQELISAVKRGFLYQGQIYPWQQNPRGTPTRGFARSRFVHFLENHDQVANIGFGERMQDLAHPGALRALTALLLLTPGLPMLFQGQETGSRAPWTYFVDHGEWLRDPIRQGRAAFMAQFVRAATPAVQAALPDPCDEATFRACILDPALRRFDRPIVRMHRDLLALRRTEHAFTDPRETAMDAALLGDRTFAIRFFQDDSADDRLLVVNLGHTRTAAVVPEPLIAPPRDLGWHLTWSTEEPRYGGHGSPAPVQRSRLTIPAYAAILLEPDRGSHLSFDPAAISGDQDPSRITP